MSINLDAVGDFISSVAEDVVPLEWRLQQVERIEIEGIEAGVGPEGARRGIELTRADIGNGQPSRDRRARAARQTRRGGQAASGERAIPLVDGLGVLVAEANDRVAATVVEVSA